jgi:methylmalonyl-CoA/ethylmalonyl-CoA epimerase
MTPDRDQLGLKFHHVGIGVTDFAAAIELYQKLGHELLQCVGDKGLGVWVAFLAAPGETAALVEVLAPLGPNTPLAPLISRRVLPAPYHTGYAVSDLDQASGGLRAHDFMPVTEPAPAIAMGRSRVAFFYHLVIGLVELIENPPEFRLPLAVDQERFAEALRLSAQ